MAFLGAAATSQFTSDNVNKTVAYSGSPTDFTYRRMVLHYANLCIVAGGVDLFLIGSEFRGLETIRGPGWTITGTTDGGGNAIWDYPFVAGMITLSDDVRRVFDTAGSTKDLTGLHNLISYAADWSDWMGWQHPDASPALPVAGRTMATSRSALGTLEHRPRLLRQLHAALRLDDGRWQSLAEREKQQS